MPRLAVLVIAATALAPGAATPARVGDGLFGNLLGPIAAVPTTDPFVAQAATRDREARNIRREYWERERARIAAGTRPAATLVAR